MGLFDFSQPAARAKKLLISSATSSMITVLLIAILVGIGALVLIDGIGGFICLVISVAIGILFAIAIRNSVFYRLAILEACEIIKKQDDNRTFN